MAGIARNFNHVRPDIDVFAKDSDSLDPFGYQATRSANRLIAGKQEGVVWVRQVMPLMMHNASAGGHAASSDNHLWIGHLIYQPGFLGVQSGMQTRKIKKVLVARKDFPRVLVEILLVLLEYFGQPDSQRRIQQNKHDQDAVVLHQIIYFKKEFLGTFQG